MQAKTELPQDWKWVKLAEVCEIKSGKNQSKVLNPKGKYPIYGSSGIFGYADDYICDEGTTIIGRKGTINSPLYVQTKFWNVDTAFGISPNTILDKKLFYYFCLSFNFHKLDKSTTIPSLAKTDLLKIDIPLPPTYIQPTIVAKIDELFSEVDKGIEEMKTTQQQLKIYRQAVLKWAFEGKLTNENVKEGQMPNGWKLIKLKDITLEKEGLRRGPFGSAIKKSFFVPEGYKVYEQGNAINDDPYRGSYYVDADKYQELINFRVVPRDLIVSCSGVTLGRISEIPEDARSGIINQALLRIRLQNKLILNDYFVKHFRAAFFQRKIFDQSQGTAMPNLVGIKDFKEIELMLPSVKEQQQIVDEIESRLSVCDKIEETITNSLKQAEALRQSILKKAFEGKLNNC